MRLLNSAILLVLCLFGTGYTQEIFEDTSTQGAIGPGDFVPDKPDMIETPLPVEISRGDKKLSPAKLSALYRKKWALVVGVNYADRDDVRAGSATNAAALPPLGNAVQDAKEISSTLQEFFGYQEACVTELFESDASFAAIETGLGSLCNLEKVSKDDSVLVFISGHGVRTTRGTSFLAHDVQLSSGIPNANHILLSSIVERLEDCPAKHKILILDHCYSGDVFNSSFQSPSLQDRSDEGLLRVPAFQAMASCRATQVALDAGRLNKSHSPFTAALIDGLTRLPAGGRKSDAIGASKLASYISTTFDVASQKPECRNLISTEGEFSFWPADVSFDQFRVKDGDRNLLNAMTSRNGDWWFNERPWFIPGVRSLILQQLAESQSAPRGSVSDREINESALKLAAEKAFQQRDSYRESTKRYYQLLQSTQGTDKFQDALRAICGELEAQNKKFLQPVVGVDKSDALQPEDLHLLAIIQHALKQSEESLATYRKAEEAYNELRKTGNTEFRIASALCSADIGELLLEEMGKAAEAADKFREAESGIRTLAEERDAGAVFRMSVMCREANAFLRINRWNEANKLLDDALALTKSFGSESYFAAQVHRNRAWAETIQWHMRKATNSFEKSNEILVRLFRKECEATPNEQIDSIFASNTETNESSHTNAQNAFRNLNSTSLFHQSKDFESKLAFLHNLHGIAMAQRFLGDTSSATQNYRSLARHVEATFSDLAQGDTTATLSRFYTLRSINTQERLGDCNLFGDPRFIDLKEAVDDYRRARNLVHTITGIQRRQIEAVLLYKTAIAISMPSEYQDTEMALEMCKQADAIFEFDENARVATGQYWALGKLTTPMVSLLNQKACKIDTGCSALATKLREVILSCRDILGQQTHRDQLEILLFAAKVLLEYGPMENRFILAEDSDLLLKFCRLALQSYRFDGYLGRSESQAYLRPYYDAVMRAKLAIPDRKNVLDLLEVQFEATNGVRYMKPEHAQPILATYVLDDECFLLMDLPRGTSKAFSLSAIYDNSTIQAACYSNEQLTLPGELLGQLKRWLADNQNQLKSQNSSDLAQIDVRWVDPVRLLTASAGADTTQYVVRKFAYEDEQPIGNAHCPFALPMGFTNASINGR